MASLFRPRPRNAICQCQRAFTTSSPRSISLQWEKNDPDSLADNLPPYPYGPTRWYKQSRLGLYGGQRIRFGNNVGEKIEVKTRRTWHPNILTRKLFSKSLDRHVQVRVSARVLRTIDKLGGLDEYLLGEKEARIKTLGESGWWLRWAIMQTPAIKRRFAEERKRVGVPEEVAQQTEAEVAEAQTVIEEATETEVEVVEQEGEVLSVDGAFEIEQTPDLPPLKFRVGRGKHIVLTASGWRRTRPDRSRWVDPVIDKIQAKLEERLLPQRLEEFNTELNEQQETARARSQKLAQLYYAAQDAVEVERLLVTEAEAAVKAQQEGKETEDQSEQREQQEKQLAAAEEAKQEAQKKRDEFEEYSGRSVQFDSSQDDEQRVRNGDLFEERAVLSMQEQEELRAEVRKDWKMEIRAYAVQEYERLAGIKEEKKAARKERSREQRAVDRAKRSQLEEDVD